MILNPKLLVVDDERGIVDMIQSYFQTRYDILTAYSGQEALKKVAYKPDLILLDINMPGMDGLTVCQKIREHIACPILFLICCFSFVKKWNCSCLSHIGSPFFESILFVILYPVFVLCTRVVK